MVRMKWWRTLALCVLAVGVLAPVTAAPASAAPDALEVAAPAPPVAPDVWTGLNGPRLGLDAAAGVAAQECAVRSDDPFQRNFAVWGRARTDCNVRVARIFTTVRLWRHFASTGWRIVDSNSHDVTNIKRTSTVAKKACRAFKPAYYYVTGFHAVYFYNGSAGSRTTHSNVTVVACR